MSETIKERVQKFWDATPCGTGMVEYPEGSKAFFEEVAAYRRKREIFVPAFAEFGKWSGKKVLEVGCGAGSDIIEFARSGADVTGVDLSPRSVELTRMRFEVYGLNGSFQVADAENLPFEDDTFDCVYSCGVLHHTPDTQKSIDEVYRVMKPDGEARIMLYHKPSVVALQMWILFGLLRGHPFRKIDDLFYHHHESIGTKAYTVGQARAMFSVFDDLVVKTLVTPHCVRYSRTGYMPYFVMKLVPKFLGWYLLIKGKKQAA